MNMKRLIGAVFLGAGLTLTAATGTAFAETPTAGSGGCPEGKGGYDCQTDTSISEGEADCYEGAAWGGAAGVLTGNPVATLAGAAVGCAKGATGN